MTDPSQNPFGHNPFGDSPFGGGSMPPQSPPPPPPVQRDEANTLATLSVVFAFLFAPAGAILGHLGLAQIRRTGQRGRDRALVGVVLSYVFITVGVVVLIVGLTMVDTEPTRTTAPATTTARHTATTPTTTTPPPPPTVAPADLDGLLPTLDDVKNITGDPNLKGEKPVHSLTPLSPKDGSYDRPECAVTIAAAIPDAYPMTPQGISVSGFFDLQNASNPRGSVQSVAAFTDVAAAQKQLGDLQSVWRGCGGSTVKLTYADTGHTAAFSIGVPADSSDGITTLEVQTQGQPVRFVMAIAAKNNVFLEVRASSTASDRAHQAALDVANSILGKIPG
jgi:hypothetical protein